LIPGITLEEINERADQWISDDNRVITVSGPEKEEAGIPDEAALLAVFDGVNKLAVTPWVDKVRDEPLVASEPETGRVVEETVLSELGVTRWKLDNGIIVLLKPTDFKNDEIVLQGYSPGGHSLRGRDGRRQLQPDRAAEGPDRQGGQRVGRDQRAIRGSPRERVAQGSRDDVPVALPQVHWRPS
jgi:hypothetical protein